MRFVFDSSGTDFFALKNGADDSGFTVGEFAICGFDYGGEGFASVLCEELTAEMEFLFGDVLFPVEGFAVLDELGDVSFDGRFCQAALLGNGFDGHPAIDE